MILTTSFLWHESEDINKKGYFSKISVHSNFTFNQVMHDYVHWLCSIGYCFELQFSLMRVYVKIAFILHWNDFWKFLWEHVLFVEELQVHIDAKNSYFDIFESTPSEIWEYAFKWFGLFFNLQILSVLTLTHECLRDKTEISIINLVIWGRYMACQIDVLEM